jgi:hypothetical protein
MGFTKTNKRYININFNSSKEKKYLGNINGGNDNDYNFNSLITHLCNEEYDKFNELLHDLVDNPNVKEIINKRSKIQACNKMLIKKGDTLMHIIVRNNLNENYAKFLYVLGYELGKKNKDYEIIQGSGNEFERLKKIKEMDNNNNKKIEIRRLLQINQNKNGGNNLNTVKQLSPTSYSKEPTSVQPKVSDVSDTSIDKKVKPDEKVNTLNNNTSNEDNMKDLIIDVSSTSIDDNVVKPLDDNTSDENAIITDRSSTSSMPSVDPKINISLTTSQLGESDDNKASLTGGKNRIKHEDISISSLTFESIAEMDNTLSNRFVGGKYDYESNKKSYNIKNNTLFGRRIIPEDNESEYSTEIYGGGEEADKIHQKVIEKIKEVMKLKGKNADLEARVLKAVLYKHIKGNNPDLNGVERAKKMLKDVKKTKFTELEKEIKESQDNIRKHLVEKVSRKTDTESL